MRFLTAGLFAGIFAGLASQPLLAADTTIVGTVRIQCLSDSLARLEVRGAEGFEDRPTFHVVNRDWPGTTVTTNASAAEVVVRTPNYSVHVPAGATSLAGVYLTSAAGQTLYAYDGKLNNSVWLPGPAAKPQAWSFADTPRLVPPAWGIAPAPAGAPLAASSGWDTNNDAADVYVFVPGGSYQQLRQDFLKLTGPTPLIPLYALGAWDSRWFDYSEATALAQVDAYRSRQFPLDVLVCDTGWRVNASTGYQPNTNLFPDLPHFFAAAHAKNVRVMFNDHPEPVAAGALDPQEVTYRYTNLTQLLGEGLDVWWYDRNWNISLFSPASNLRHEVWGMRVYHDATAATNATLRPMIMVNVDGIDNGMRNRPMNVAAHTYPIQWTGDIGPSSLYLKNAVENAVHSGVQALFPYESDDLGGHTSDPTPEGYIRWIEYGALSPIYRPHCTYNLTRMPWTFGPEAEWTARRFVNLRYRLLPVFYAAARENYDTGEPILRRLDLDYPQYPEASQEDQYLIGHSLLVAPVIGDSGTPVPAAWLTTTTGQPGLNAAYYANTNLAGAPDLARVDASIDFNWNSASPGGTVPAVNFTARWTGNITVPPDMGNISLAALSDDGVRVWLNGQLCIDNWGPNDSVTTGATNVLQAGLTYALRVEYLQ
ncbi:MAG TPA: TIM-barrel domain-containing protein, partial [Dongiaceae bacterium]|nr:TIM-barrel domain-containing protein [Dongiaceae bacterium]